MKLVIVESPTKVKTISKYLGKDFKVMASKGHFRDLANTGYHNLGIDIENNFKPDYEIQSNKKYIVSKLKEVARNSDEVYLATDPDREGEAISWHITQVLDLDIKTTPRLEFNEITPFGISNAMKAPRVLDMNLVKSQETRRMIDRIMGYELSNLLQKKLHSQSGGRVQSAVLKIVCDREEEIKAFIPEDYYEIYAEVQDGKLSHKVKLSEYQGKKVTLASEQEADDLIAKLNSSLLVKEIEEEEKDYYAAPPFTTSSLQQEAFNILHLSTKTTMKIAQTLYEGVETGHGVQGAITYMRTDSYRLSPIFINAAKKEIETFFGPEYVGKAYAQKSKANVQDAHEGIRPTSASLYPKEAEKHFGDKHQVDLYRLIYNRAVASMMKPRHQINTKVALTSGDYVFSLEDSKVTFLGWQKLYNPRNIESKNFEYNFKKGDELQIINITKKKETTKPLSRFSEAQLVRTMEELGIGRPSTYAQTIETLKTRHYCDEKRGVLYPTDQGMITAKRLSQYFATLVDAQYTASLETQLDKVAEGNEAELSLLRDFTDEFYNLLKYADETMDAEPTKVLDEVCPECGHPLVMRYSKKGSFIGCSNYPQCHYIKREEEKPVAGEGELCPKCKKGHLVKKRSSYGLFLGCDQYPECHYVQSIKKRYKKFFVSKKKTTTSQ
ncbi:MAG: type I DNA topoisomerase [Bacilli bacterium]|nr:type I DNA topoisomerase [Bacilli bacterium]MDD3422657.1 type I DNA topoisomerase [Bacilli bacterium]MDD4065756.1 type I DNA topoisomerase [Bacilli bacterium]